MSSSASASAPVPDSGWFLPLPKAAPIGHDYRPQVTPDSANLVARIKSDPDDREAIDALAAHYEARDDRPSLANLMDGWGEHLARRQRYREAASAWVRAAEATLSCAGKAERARSLLERALLHDPANESALRELHAVLAIAREHHSARQWLEFVADALIEERGKASYRARVCYRLAKVLEYDLCEPAAALPRYAEALREDNTYDRARDALARLQDVLAPAADPDDAIAAATVTARPSPIASSPPVTLAPETELDAVDGLPVLEVNLGVTTDSNFYCGFSIDPLKAGVFVATYQEFPVGTELKLMLTLPGGLLAPATGRVRFVREGLSDEEVPGLLVELRQLAPSSVELIARFMEKRTPIFFST